MVIYPLSAAEETAIRWATRVVPALAMGAILFLTAITVASAQA